MSSKLLVARNSFTDLTTFCSDSGAQYFDGTCDTTRTVHFGRPAPEMCEAYTRVLQGHVRFIYFS